MILIYVDELTPRVEYILKLIFEDILKIKVSLTKNKSEFRKSDLPKINYSNIKFENELYLKSHKILFDKTINYPDFESAFYKGEKYFFSTSEDSFLSFDPFAASFFVVSRFEEYLETGKGKYNCYPAEKSILTKHGLLKKPVVNIWAQILAQKIHERYPEFEIPVPQFNFISTIDIDNAWAFAHKGLFRSVGAFIKDVLTAKPGNIKNRVRVWFDPKKDPFNNYEYISQIFKENEDKVIFFFLLGDYRKYDKNVSYKNKYFRKLIHEFSEDYKVGIHPSFYSSKTKGNKNLATEITRIESITGKKVGQSRQHFLRLFFPHTYRNLVKNGINEDYSMGYSSHIGFRAGICTPFHFYDLENEKETNLKIFPFQVMDVTLREYLNLDVNEAKTEIGQLMEEVRKAGGTFISIWHNETLTDSGRWEGYREVFEYVNKMGFSLANE